MLPALEKLAGLGLSRHTSRLSKTNSSIACCVLPNMWSFVRGPMFRAGNAKSLNFSNPGDHCRMILQVTSRRSEMFYLWLSPSD